MGITDVTEGLEGGGNGGDGALGVGSEEKAASIYGDSRRVGETAVAGTGWHDGGARGEDMNTGVHGAVVGGGLGAHDSARAGARERSARQLSNCRDDGHRPRVSAPGVARLAEASRIFLKFTPDRHPRPPLPCPVQTETASRFETCLSTSPSPIFPHRANLGNPPVIPSRKR